MESMTLLRCGDKSSCPNIHSWHKNSFTHGSKVLYLLPILTMQMGESSDIIRYSQPFRLLSVAL